LDDFLQILFFLYQIKNCIIFGIAIGKEKCRYIFRKNEKAAQFEQLP